MKILNYIFVLLVIYSCGTLTKTTYAQNDVEQNDAIEEMVSEECETIVTIRDYTATDGCQFLFQLEDKRLLLPTNVPNSDIPYYEGAGAKIGYRILGNNQNRLEGVPCSEHDQVVEITCMEQYIFREDNLPISHDKCERIKNPYSFSWMRKSIGKYNPSWIKEYKYNPGYLYLFETEDNKILFDCLGNEMCDILQNGDCASLIETLSDPKVILVANN